MNLIVHRMHNTMYNAQPATDSRTTAGRAPRSRPVLAIVVLLMLAIVVGIVAKVSAARKQTLPQAVSASADIRQLRVLRFDDAPDGSVAAIDMSTGQLVQRFEGEQGFLRGTLRAMVRERRLHGIGAGQPFELILLHDGRLTLHDPATGLDIALESFGATNTGVFARLLN